MEYTRLLRRGMSGADVRYMKDALLRLGYLNKSTHDSFGDDTFAAVKAFQRSNRDLSGKRLIVDGVIGKRTWAAITRALSAEPGEPGNPEEIPPNIGTGAAEAISAALAYLYLTRHGSEVTLGEISDEFGCSMRRLTYYTGRIAGVLERLEGDIKDENP